MPAAAQLEGQRFGLLTVVERNGYRQYKSGKAFRVVWRCLCACGNELNTTTDMLRKGEAKSCGCQQLSGISKRKRDGEEIGFVTLYNSYKNNKRNKDFNLPQDIFKQLTSSNCTYCNTPPKQECRPHRLSTAVYIYNGLDRVDTSKGYVLGNVVPSCKYCNYAKNSLTKNAFFTLIKTIYEFNALGNVKTAHGDLAKHV